jgi:probable phosphoglycerate mutase
MKAVRLLLIRHGETDWNRALRFQGQIDVPLNAMGREQARRVGQRLAALHRRGDVAVPELHSSDLQRAVQTATPITWASHHTPDGGEAHTQSVPVNTVCGLREQHFGVFEGHTAHDNQTRHPDLWDRWRRFDANFALPGGGESTQAFHDRVITALLDLCRQTEAADLTVVTHGGVLDMVWRHAQGEALQGPRRCDIPNAGLNRLRFEAGRFHIDAWGDVDHLAGMPPQPVYRTTDAALPPLATP